MVAYADTGFVVSIYLAETTSARAMATARKLTEPLPVTSFFLLEFRNALNLAVKRTIIDISERNKLWLTFEEDMADGHFSYVTLPAGDLNRRARELSDRHTPLLGTRSLDLLHVAAALTLGAREMLTFDERQRKAAKAEGLKVRP
jgi:predicted nucleic acid-binding protein